MAADMIYYASLGKKGKVKECLQNGVFVDAMNFKKETSLLFAAKNGHLPTVTLLLDAGANPNQENVNCLTPTIAAAIGEHKSCLQQLLHAGGVWDVSQEESTWLDRDLCDLKEKIGQDDIFLNHQSRCIDVSGIFIMRDCRINSRPCAAKIQLRQPLHQNSTNDGSLAEDKLKKEFEFLRSLRHPNILQCYHTSTSKEMKYNILIIEPIMYGNLYHVIYDLKTKITIQRGKSILKQTIQAMSFLHSQHIIHNFLNSTSIYLICEWIVKVGNLEYASYTNSRKSEEEKDGITVTNMSVIAEEYHLPYTAPEIIRDCDYSEYSDVYSFGCMAWELFGRKRPWSWLDKNDVISLAQVTHNVRLPIQEFWPTFLHIIIEKCANQNKSDRPSFMELYHLIFKNTIQEESFLNPMKFKVPTIRIVNHHDPEGIKELTTASTDYLDSEKKPNTELNSFDPGNSTADKTLNENKVSRVKFSDVIDTTLHSSQSKFSNTATSLHQPKKSCLRNLNLRSSLIKKAILSNTQIEHPSVCGCDKDVVPQPTYGESVEKLIGIQTVDSTFNNLKGIGNEANSTEKVRQYLSLNQQAKSLQNMKEIVADAETLILHRKVRDSGSSNLYVSSENIVKKDEERKNKMIQEVFKIAGKHQKKNWARATYLDRDYFGKRCYKSKSWCKIVS